ncbi:MAG: protease complex subunit PrcB family protein [Blastocatellia bacterium]
MKAPVRSSFCVSLVALFFLLSTAARGQELERKADFETISKNFASGQAEKMSYVVTTRDEWERLWDATLSNAYPRPPAPEIDFTNHSIIAVFQGNQPSSGYDISISKVVKSGRKLKVYVKEVSPDLPCKVILVITQPFQIIQTEKIDDAGKVRFKVKSKITRCE